MVLDNLFRQNTILGSAAKTATLRNEIITNNLANSDVPKFKAKAVDFEDSLIKALDKFKKTRELDMSDVRATVRHTNENYDYRIDKNNVDVDMEMVNLYQNSVKFDTLINCMQRNSARLTLALTGR